MNGLREVWAWHNGRRFEPDSAADFLTILTEQALFP